MLCLCDEMKEKMNSDFTSLTSAISSRVSGLTSESAAVSSAHAKFSVSLSVSLPQTVIHNIFWSRSKMINAKVDSDDRSSGYRLLSSFSIYSFLPSLPPHLIG